MFLSSEDERETSRGEGKDSYSKVAPLSVIRDILGEEVSDRRDAEWDRLVALEESTNQRDYDQSELSEESTNQRDYDQSELSEEFKAELAAIVKRQRQKQLVASPVQSFEVEVVERKAAWLWSSPLFVRLTIFEAYGFHWKSVTELDAYLLIAVKLLTDRTTISPQQWHSARSVARETVQRLSISLCGDTSAVNEPLSFLDGSVSEMDQNVATP